LLHVLTDAAQYIDGTVVSFGNKTATLPQWPGVITCTGSAFNIALFRSGLAEQFASWDAMIAGAEGMLPDLVRGYGLMWSTIILAGISKERGPEAYIFTNDAEPPAHISREEIATSPLYGAPFKLFKLPDVIMTPPVPPETVIAARWEGIDADAEPESVVWSMRKHLTMQRHMPLPGGLGGIGGWGELTTVRGDSVVIQRIIDRWSDDKAGAPLHHGPINWDRWHADNPKPGTKARKLELAK
jgi:hypothetical protein